MDINTDNIPRDCTECSKYHVCNNAYYGSTTCKPIKLDGGNNDGEHKD